MDHKTKAEKLHLFRNLQDQNTQTLEVPNMMTQKLHLTAVFLCTDYFMD